MVQWLLVNFGGPRDRSEIASFLEELLCDKDVVRTRLPSFLHNWLFGKIARKRALKIVHDYDLIGGRSPIFFDTEIIGEKLNALTFHRYLPLTHKESIEKIEKTESAEIRVLPLFPQFTYATTGSIARFFSENLSLTTQKKLRWIKSYADHPKFIASFQKKISDFLIANDLKEEETALLFSAHGIPKKFVLEGDPYQIECELSYQAIMKGFPLALGRLCYQSKFGPGEWLRPYTIDMSENVRNWHEDRKNIVFVPLSFTSDHIETLFEVENQYLPPIREQNLKAYRCPALNLESYWIDSLKDLFNEKNLFLNESLIRTKPRHQILST